MLDDPFKRREIEDAVRAEFRAGGKPVAKYEELDADENLNEEQATALAVEVVLNLEERICHLEARAGEVAS